MGELMIAEYRAIVEQAGGEPEQPELDDEGGAFDRTPPQLRAT